MTTYRKYKQKMVLLDLTLVIVSLKAGRQETDSDQPNQPYLSGKSQDSEEAIDCQLKSLCCV